jgi:hypothetical protein
MGVLPPLAFRGIQAADFSMWDGAIESAQFQSLTRDIKNILGPPATPEPEHFEPELTEIKPSEPEPGEPTPAEVEPPVHAAKEAQRISKYRAMLVFLLTFLLTVGFVFIAVAAYILIISKR